MGFLLFRVWGVLCCITKECIWSFIFGVTRQIHGQLLQVSKCKTQNEKHAFWVYICVCLTMCFDSVGYLAHDKVNETSISICD
jgi:membrane-anchored glycerophosphoryl diester phosphodiesterase (GDPDase)